MKKIILINIISIITLNAFGQFSDNPRVLADNAYKNKNYYEAAYYYKEAANGLTINPDVVIPFRSDGKPAKKVEQVDRDYVNYRLADSYRLYENYIEAEGWYFKVVDDGGVAKYPLARLWYGVCLRADQHFDKAIDQFELFVKEYNGDEKYIDIANKELLNCRFAKEQYQYPSLLSIVKMNGSAFSDGSDYAIDINSGKRYFTSSRIMKDDKKHLNRIYIMGDSLSDRPTLVKFNDAETKNIEFGTPSINQSGTRMYFTRWYKEGSKTTHAIYMSNLSNGEWGEPVKLNSNVNAEGYNAIQPFITSDGKRLFFVSNKPGGQGGDDIWVCDLGADGNPINSANLGNTVNTPLDEEAPYYNVLERKLIYSSKGFIGLGGFDFFETFEDGGGQWTKPRNMGYPMNSAKDDLYYLPDNNNPKKSYISSDRESDCCLDLFEVYDKNYVFKGMVTDCDAHIPLQGVTVSFIDSLSKQTIRQVETGAKGTYIFNVPNKRPFSMRLEKKGYFTKNLPIPAEGKMKGDTLINPDICLQAFVVNKPIVIKNILYDFNKATLRPESMTMLDVLVKIMVDNPKIKVELSAHTDSIGSDAYNLKLSQDRAQSCVDYMISKGVSNDRIFAKGYGKSRPIAPNSLPNGKDNPDGRQLNRRTEFTVLKTE